MQALPYCWQRNSAGVNKNMITKIPNEDARKSMMSAARSRKNPNNSFFIEKETGAIKTTAYRDEKGYFPTVPTGTYEIHITKVPFLTYDELDEIIEAQLWGVREHERADGEED